MASYSQIQIVRHRPEYWTATFDHPPINLVDLVTIKELQQLVDEIESDPDLHVVVFNSADPEFFLAHFDAQADQDTTTQLAPGRAGLHPWLDVLVRLSRAPVVSIASIRGRARGGGSEFALACDMRFASREKAILGQFEVGVSTVPGGNPMARLPGLVGRGRALEIVLGGDDFPGDLAERYGYVNRAVPDAELDAFVQAFATRLAGFDKLVLAETKAFVDRVSLPDDAEFAPALDAFFRSAGRPAAAQRISALLARGLQQRSDVEMNLGAHVAR
jgi:enoyl-CoA hydratase/carnithine racemase